MSDRHRHARAVPLDAVEKKTRREASFSFFYAGIGIQSEIRILHRPPINGDRAERTKLLAGKN